MKLFKKKKKLSECKTTSWLKDSVAATEFYEKENHGLSSDMALKIVKKKG